jgi:tetratricopeptide (TPR) repeat protein
LLVDVRQAVLPVLDRAVKMQRDDLLGFIFGVLGTYSYFVEEDFDSAFDFLSRSREMAERTQNMGLSYSADIWMGVAHVFRAEFASAALRFRSAIENARIPEEVSLAKAHLAWGCHSFNDDVRAGVRASGEALQMVKESGTHYYSAWAYGLHGWCLFQQGALAAAEHSAHQCTLCCKRANLPSLGSCAQYILGVSAFHQGRYTDSSQHLQEALAMLDTSGVWPSYGDLYQLALARTVVFAAIDDIRLDLLRPSAQRNRLTVFEGTRARHMAQILFGLGGRHAGEAQEWIERAIAADTRHRIQWSLGRDFAVLAREHADSGRHEEANTCCAKAIEVFTRCGSTGWAKACTDQATAGK